MKKILHIVEAMGGGVFTYIVDLANQLCDEYDVYIAYQIRTQTPLNYKDYFDKRVHLISVKNFTRSISPIKDFKAFFEIKSIAKEIQPDIIHLHSSKAGALGRLAFNGQKVPMFYTPHGYSFLMQNYGLVKKNIYKAIEILSSKRCCTTISCSKGEHDETLKLTNRSTYVNNGINIHALQNMIEQCSKANSNTFTVFTLGRICYQKNPEQFNAVAEQLSNIKFLWIGDGELRGKLTSPNITITGWVDRDKAIEYSMGCDIFMLTSLWEGLPIALLESMYMKKLCIVSNVIGNRDVIKNSVNGFVCDDVKEFVKALNYTKLDYNSKLIEYAYADIMKEYNTNIMGEKYSLIYKQGMSVKNEKNRNYFIRIFSSTSS